MIEPIRLSFEVRTSREHAWAIWTERIGQWWPADHTETGEEGLEVVLETRLGGRIFERTQDGRERDWGRVTVWEPPSRLVYLWHLKRQPAEATEVEIRFVSAAQEATRVEITHRGWEALGGEGENWRNRNFGGWSSLLPHYVSAAGGGTTGIEPNMEKEAI